MLGLQPHSSLLSFIKHAVSTTICRCRGAVEGEGQVGVSALLAGGAGLPECHWAGGGHSAVRLRGEGPFDVRVWQQGVSCRWWRGSRVKVRVRVRSLVKLVLPISRLMSKAPREYADRPLGSSEAEEE